MYNASNNNWLKTCNYLCMNTLKTRKKCFFGGCFSKEPETDIYINDNESYSDNKYRNKIHNIVKGLSGALNYNK